MRRPRGKKKSIGVSLFPFMAVLICTMGALIVLLVLVVKRASVYAQEQQQQVTSEWAEEEQRLLQEQETEDFRQSTLRDMRPELTQRLADHRNALSHVESHIRQLQSELQQLREQFADLQNIDERRDSDVSAGQQQLARLRQQIARAEQVLVDAKRRAANQRRSFAVVPYEGPNGTRRRPIFIECKRDRVILQPEGIELSANDFRQPLLPGNPLDAALLAVRDYLQENGGADTHGEPYPLLLCRSDGTLAYNKARSAMRSWDDEFGYELIDKDSKLVYPNADPQLAKIITQAVERARLRQRQLARSQPARFRGGDGGEDGQLTLRASPTRGGFIVEGEPGQGQGVSESPPRTDDGFGTSPNGNPLRQPTAQQVQQQQAQQPPSRPNENSQPAGSPQSRGPAMPVSVANRKGHNWALPSKSQGATPFRRPVNILCFPDRLVIVAQRGTTQRTQAVPLAGATEDSIQQFVAAIWQHMETWGIAGRNAYWRPELHVQVAPGGERRFAELNALMVNSGFDITTTN